MYTNKSFVRLLSNRTVERSISWLRQIENYLRSTVVAGEIDSLATMNIEVDSPSTLNRDDRIDAKKWKRERERV